MSKRYHESDIPEAAAALKRGELVAFPTETVYGLGADATNVTAVGKVYAAKGRPSDNPLIVTVADADMVGQYATITPLAAKLMEAFWPGPLTIILNILPGRLSMKVTGGLQTAAFRNPDNALTRKLIATAGVPIVGPSANTSGKPSPTTADHVLHDLDGKIAGVLDDGPTQVGVESAIIDLTVTPPAILRPGAIGPDELEPLIGHVDTAAHHVGQNEAPKAPGMKYKHYAPAAQVVVVDDPAQFSAAVAWAKQTGQVFGLLATDAILAQYPTIPSYSLGKDVQSAAHALFAGLRWFDLHPDVTLVLAQAFSKTELSAAYMNRLLKSAGDMHFQG
ncbi:L-threonylcarbamoyladenylate synthase [Lacticaseibacillus paracasei]|uniref:Threonylcarbamoyl-AMP synthase n=1 Tax=Lacticaseibacillus paracasei subsp. paracasei Lpp122 TaxID=1256218 RepID=A0A8E0I546_LACPA|nr:L-threonylcarbamoyladenylate synthase [Lacticaseibacillus paracasei]EEI67027.1 Sua5/YciO/YrdC/YwlC family protein [Lacticaseibacillus paracasei subsp. paracasei ATCC 25302 = DSM 5622 = JCM 8130]EPC19247.1 translation factor, SUA5 family [Lacticaseibacillus paracasei subsp. paracasei Lpp122]KRM66361.1 translation factor SUA5 [Lacticaseibacillus paracasei subsp. paracasei ATCC 25302 = DSM 5622 = JCM 8130]MBA4474129.1 threonylcarbamoyl-AMP synthase [Lacticaseibacillus paracasei]MCT3336187.1 th